MGSPPAKDSSRRSQPFLPQPCPARPSVPRGGAAGSGGGGARRSSAGAAAPPRVGAATGRTGRGSAGRGGECGGRGGAAEPRVGGFGEFIIVINNILRLFPKYIKKQVLL